MVERSSIARGTLYHHFSSKEDLLDALVERMTHEGIARAKAIISDGNIPLLEKLLVGVVPLIVQLIEEGNESGLFDAKWH